MESSGMAAPWFKVMGEGTVWFDAAQLEAGEKATPYVRDDY